MRYTTGCHLLVRLFGFFLAIAIWALCAEVAELITSYFGVLKGYDPMVIAIPFGIPLGFLVMYLIGGFLGNVASYGYLRFNLRVPVSFAEARSVAFLFSEDADGKWYPLDEIHDLPKEQRRGYLFTFASRIVPRT